ncbi:LamG-like jellyroll fold domain-containing protein [Streptomyces solincola]|uniref:LamG-like jellyroll fold domain-containing protein n=1 Tax=Streptomyces solincola TaxID=2100817 RepID=UPI002158FE9A|nr:LamG-like jellyroll fold domain-containing protein [Streptomyces solincola]
MHVEEGTISVVPDPRLLRGPDTVYPVYIDPTLGLGVSERSVLSSDGDRWWNFNGDHGVGRCYRVGPYYCDADHTNRMYFEFAPTRLAGKHVIDATFRAYETWSFSCSPHNLQLWRTDNISEGTRWPGPAKLDLMRDRSVSAGRGDHCTPEQPGRWIEFNDASAESDENLTPTVRNFADGRFSRLTLMLQAADESNADAWKRFDDNAELKVVYVLKPGAVTDDGVIPGNGTVQGCSTSDATPVVATRLDPLLQARVQTSVKPAGTEERGSLRAHFWVERKMPDGSWSDSRYNVPSTGYYIDDTIARQRLTGGVDGALYRVRSLTQTFWTYEGATTAMSSGYRRWCYFKLDTTAPKAPTITSAGPYTECTVDSCPGRGGPGVAGKFTLKPNAADKDVIGYRWRLLTERPEDTHRGNGSQITITPEPGTAGAQVLVVEAIDVRDRAGTPAEFHFKVAPAQGETSRWHFDDGTPDSGVTKAADSATTEGAPRHDLTLYGDQVGWSPGGRSGTGDHSLILGSNTGAAGEPGHARTSAAPVNTRDSFTISTWAYLHTDEGTQVVASAPGTSASAAFNLYYSGSSKKWVFNRAVTDSAAPSYVKAAVASEPVQRAWTHLTGVFDTKGDSNKSNDTIQLFVNGRPQGAPVVLAAANAAYTPWTSSKGMYVGGSQSGEHFKGRVDEMALWQRALTGEEIRQEHRLEADGAPATELVAHWDGAAMTSTSLTERTAYLRSDLDLSATGATPDQELDQLRLDGKSGHASGAGAVIDETASFTVTASVKLDGARFAAMPVGTRAHVFGQAAPGDKESSWALWVEKVSADGYLWRFGRTATDATGKVVLRSTTESQDAAELDTWVQVTGVFDATEEAEAGFGGTRLYVGPARQDDVATSSFTAPQQGKGAIAAGRGPAGGVNGHYLPGSLTEMRIWVGAMTEEHVRTKVMGASGA